MLESTARTLSVNKLSLQFDSPERDDRGGDVIEAEKAGESLLVANMQLAKAIERNCTLLGPPSVGTQVLRAT
jgi:hypothetical protein